MNNTAARLIASTLCLGVFTAAMSGCSEDPQEKYKEAIEQLEQARDSRDEAQEQLKSQKQELADLQSKLDKAQGKLQQAGQNVDQASQQVDKTVTDPVLFRTIQRELLDKKNFDKAAISVGVDDRVVTLSGNVPDDDARKRAVKIANNQAGVKSVQDNLKVVNKDKDGGSKDAKQSGNGDAQSNQQPSG